MLKAQSLDIDANRDAVSNPPLASNHHAIRLVGTT